MLEVGAGLLMFVVILAAFVSLLTSRAVGPAQEVALDQARKSFGKLVKKGDLAEQPDETTSVVVELVVREGVGLLELFRVRPDWLTSVHPLGVVLTPQDVTKVKEDGTITDEIWDRLVKAAYGEVVTSKPGTNRPNGSPGA
jgi:hypothetical protein